MKKTQTNAANISGLQNEDIFATLSKILAIRKGYLVAGQKELVSRVPPIFSAGKIIKADFYFEGKPFAPNGFVISAKYQEVEGTADSKVYYEVDWVIKRCIPVPTILLVRGEHWLSDNRERARIWLKEQIDHKWLKDVFFSVDELYQWASNLPDCTGFTKADKVTTPKSMPMVDLLQQGEMF